MWRLACGVTPRLRDAGDCVLAYSALSGSTHILDLVSAELLGALMGGMQTCETLRARVAEFLDVPPDAALAQRVDALLEQLDEIGLIEEVG
jgi:PqqD family protein of HPr-rel-A system